MAGATKQELVKFIKEEIEQTEQALAFVLAEYHKGSTDYGRVYARKKAEYEGVLWALGAVLDVALGTEGED